jgi:hypothetical protein
VDSVVRNLLSGNFDKCDCVKAAEHYGTVCRFRTGGKYVAAHHHIGFSKGEERWYLGSPASETPITKEQYEALHRVVNMVLTNTSPTETDQ